MNFEELVNIVAKLRGPEGCPWDREQTRDSLKPFLAEEFYELVDALDEYDYEGMKEELGDLLFQIVIQSRLSEEEGRFNINDVVKGISEKLVRRHPHVFGDKNVKTPEEVIEKWQEYKKKEGKIYSSAIGGVPESMPALQRASEIQMKATKVGFDWDRIDDVFAKLDEEVKELKDALNNKEYKEIENELGDILFVLVRIANFMNVSPEEALRKAIKKFTRRFIHIEEEAARQGKRLNDMKLAEMDVLWNEAKKKLL